MTTIQSMVVNVDTSINDIQMEVQNLPNVKFWTRSTAKLKLSTHLRKNNFNFSEMKGMGEKIM